MFHVFTNLLTLSTCLSTAGTKCEQLHDEAVAKRDKGLSGVYVPNCQSDGRFDSRQCDGFTVHCWCVDADGSEMPGTRTKFGEDQPECDEELQGIKGQTAATETT